MKIGPLKIVVVDDCPLIRIGIRSLCEKGNDFVVVAEANNGAQAVAVVREHSPDVVVMDLIMPTLNGKEATRLILREFPHARIVIFGDHTDPEWIEELTDVGISGYVLKQSPAEHLFLAMQEAAKGNMFLSPEVARIVASRKSSQGKVGGNKKLTIRESEVLQAIAEGFPNKGIATQLNISIKTVEKHRQSLMNKLNIHHIAGLTRYAIEHKYV